MALGWYRSWAVQLTEYPMKLVAGIGALVLTSTLSTAQMVAIDTALPVYKPAEGVSGSVKSVGSDTMNNLMTHWQEEFKKFYPAATTSLEGKGSGTAPTALIEGTANFGPMSREMKKEENDKFEKKFGYKPTALPTAVDALAVWVHKDCPLTEISLEQVKGVFSVEGKDMTWGDLGIKETSWASQPVSLYGRNSSSGTYGFFKEHALQNKAFKNSVKEQAGSSSVVEAVGKDKFSMGYSGLGSKTSDVKALKIKRTSKEAAIEANAANAYDGTYPLARFLYVYINYQPKSKLDPVRAEFIKMIFSRQGQEAVVKDNYFPVKVETAREALKSVGLDVKF